MEFNYPQALSSRPRSPSVILREGIIEERLGAAGIDSFDTFWDLPHTFVEPINRRRNGWSGVSVLKVADGRGGAIRFYLKRQENQLRYSWRHPFGKLTYAYEVKALQLAAKHGWPVVELAAFGFRRVDGLRQAVLLTCEIECLPLSHYEQAEPQWLPYHPVLQLAGKQLFEMHAARWQHGALFPAHVFIDFHTGSLCLIDLERARRRTRSLDAAEADLTQFIRRCDWIPDTALNAVLTRYHEQMPLLIDRLRERFPDRTLEQNEVPR